jgi:hypothetical protein
MDCCLENLIEFSSVKPCKPVLSIFRTLAEVSMILLLMRRWLVASWNGFGMCTILALQFRDCDQLLRKQDKA